VAVVAIKKIRIYSDKNFRYAVTDLMQEKGCLEIVDIASEISHDIEEYFNKENNELELQVANVEFAIKFLEKYAIKKTKKIKVNQEQYQRIVNSYYYKDIVEKCLNIEEELVKNQNHLAHLKKEEESLTPWKNLDIILSNDLESEYTMGYVGHLNTRNFEECVKEIEETSPLSQITIVSQNPSETHFLIVIEKSIQKDVEKILHVKTVEHLENLTKEARALVKEIPNLGVIHDYFSNLKAWKNVRKQFHHMDDVFAVEGWIAENDIPMIQKALDRITKANLIQHIQTDDQPPVEIKNNSFVAPFEAVTRIYGLPMSKEVDPTGFLAIFFITYFGLCLTDAGYGLMLFVMTAAALIFLDIPDETKKLVKLLMYGGISTIVLGILFGGYFGMDASELPAWLTYSKEVNGVETSYFIGQLLNPLKEPLIVLGICFLLGYIQVIVGKIIDGYWKIKHGSLVDGLCDGYLWAYALLSIGFFAFVNMVPSSTLITNLGNYSFYVALALLVLTQGRSKSNIIGKFFGGVLGLYGFIGYVSDILSYSRLLALGLATGIIAASINLIAGIIGGMIPFVGPIVMIVILVFGHTFNLALNALGSFIHSGRLQFVEFFGKFMEGGGRQFKPFKHANKYVTIEK
jgi:V/A-type H+-transporting ATPase subunit I